jgi:hypothetical protein
MILFWFSTHAFLKEFRKGTVHMNSQRFFSGLESVDSTRGDRYEGTDRIHQSSDIKSVRIIDNERGTEITIGPDGLSGSLLINFGRQSYNLLCLHALTHYPEKGSPIVDKRNLAFGDSFVVILNTQEFVNRIEASAKSADLNVNYGPVEYYDDGSYSGETGPFWKPHTYNYQREFRIAVFPGSVNPIRLSVGSLEDITTPIYPLADINRIVEFPS